MNAQQAITEHFESHNHSGPQGTQTAAEGFVAWVWGCRDQALCSLRTDMFEGLADDIIYAMVAVRHEREQDARNLPTNEDVQQWLNTHRNDLIAAIVESMT